MAQVPQPLAQKAGHAIKEMFSAIAPRYDLLNHLLSLNQDVAWRRFGAQLVPESARLVLDVGAGTGDFALTLLHHLQIPNPKSQIPNVRVVALDFSLPMLALCVQKAKANGMANCVLPLAGDGLRLPFANETFDAVISAFTVRNFEDLDAGLEEMSRVLKVGGVAVILEFCAQPKNLLRLPADLFIRCLLPPLGRLISGHAFAYSYLAASSQSFLSPSQLSERLLAAGFSQVRWVNLTFGVATAFRAVK